MLSNKEIKQIAVDCGADLAGVAPVERFEKLPADSNPRSIQPDARSVIALGFSIPRGALRGVEEQTAWHTFAMGTPYNHVFHKTYLVCRRLESMGWEAVPLFDHSPELRHKGVRVAPDKPEPDVILDLEYAAHAAGLGQVGMGKFFLTPEFGPRQMLTAVVTDAGIEPDPVFDGSVCVECGACARACPAKALSDDETSETALCAGKAQWRKLRVESCLVCRSGPVPKPFSGGVEPMRVGAACGRACVASLEDSGKLTRKFTNRFRG